MFPNDGKEAFIEYFKRVGPPNDGVSYKCSAASIDASSDSTCGGVLVASAGLRDEAVADSAQVVAMVESPGAAASAAAPGSSTAARRPDHHDRDRFSTLAHPRGGVMTGETELLGFLALVVFGPNSRNRHWNGSEGEGPIDEDRLLRSFGGTVLLLGGNPVSNNHEFVVNKSRVAGG
jgi:hypothetical protein